MMEKMSFRRKLRWNLVGILGKGLLWLMAKSSRTKVLGEEEYKTLQEGRKPVIIIIWHGRILFAPYFFRKRGIMPLISPSEDGEIVAQIVGRWGYKISRGSSSHAVVRAWGEMIRELKSGGELIIVPDGPRGPDRKLKLGCLRLAQETGAFIVPFSFSASRKKFMKSWDKFLIFYPFSRIVAAYGKPVAVDPGLKGEELEEMRQQVEGLLTELDERTDRFFQKKGQELDFGQKSP